MTGYGERGRSGRAGLAGLLWLCLATGWLLGCGGTSGQATSKIPKGDAIIQLECNVADAELWVNERFIAHVRNLRRGIALSPGQHRIEFRHDRYHTHYELMTLATRERRKLAVTMAEILP